MIKLLQTFISVYETKSITESARDLYLSQSAVSKRIHRLESELGKTLFVRQGAQPLEETVEAEILYRKSLDIVNEWNHLLTDLKQIESERIQCRIGVSHAFASIFFVEMIRHLLKNFDKVDYVMHLMNSSEVMSCIESREIDIGFIDRPLRTGRVKRYDLVSDQLVIAGRPEAKYWLVREKNSGVSYYQELYFMENNLDCPTIEINSNELILRFLRHGIGRSMISMRQVGTLPYRRLSSKYHRKYYMVVNEQKPPKYMDIIISLILDHFNQGKIELE